VNQGFRAGLAVPASYKTPGIPFVVDGSSQLLQNLSHHEFLINNKNKTSFVINQARTFLGYFV
jgi:sulfur relay (sulfurtransferase) DsrF/TusC family protein